MCTSFYMWRSYFLTFEGAHAKPEIATEGPRVAARAITYVLAILAFLSTVAGVRVRLLDALLGGARRAAAREVAAPGARSTPT